MSYRLGVDVGGTFTDLVLFDEKKKDILLDKVPTTVANQALGIMNGVKKIISRAKIDPDDITFVMHGTTAATNAILERKGVKTALIVTEGFKDVLHIMRQDRPGLYDFFRRRPEPLISRPLRFEVPERILHTGEIQNPLDEKKLKNIINRIKKENVRAIAVCLLHSYINPVHEERIGEILKKSCPEIDFSLSSEILPEIKEYERMSTTAINAYVLPIVDSYLKDLSRLLKEHSINKTVHIMQSNAGIMPSAEAGRKSASTILSGPAAGVLGGVELARQAGFNNVITVDMGGTSFDICLAPQGRLNFSSETEIAGYALKVPMIDMHTIGAGGGSIAWIDRGGALKVGPQSAGATPGPVCYGKGGSEPAVTDANLVLSRLNPDYFLGGEMVVDKQNACNAVEEKIARPLGLDTVEAAEGIIKIVNATMVKGIRFVSVEKGYDPKEFTLVCFGGNGPVHAVELAEELSIPQVVIPFAPGVNCAYGLLIADFRSDYVKAFLRKTSLLEFKEINTGYKQLEDSARKKIDIDEISEKDIIITRSLDIRYLGQGYELEVPVPAGSITKKVLESIEEKFNVLHEQSYGFKKEQEPIEIVNLRISCQGIVPKAKLKKEPLGTKNPGSALKEKREVFLKGKYYKTDIYDRDKLHPGMLIKGPAIIEQKDSTTLLFPGNQGRIDEYKNIIIKIKGGK